MKNKNSKSVPDFEMMSNATLKSIHFNDSNRREKLFREEKEREREREKEKEREEEKRERRKEGEESKTSFECKARFFS